MTVPIPEEAIEAGAAAIAGGARGMTASRRRASAVLEAAAPLIVAAELERLAESINSTRIRERSIAGQLTAVDLVREDLLARASVLRGEGAT